MNDEIPLKFLKLEIYYIYPFVFNFQSISTPKDKSVLDQWTDLEIQKFDSLRRYFPLKKGLTHMRGKRKGFPPLLPYKALVEEIGSCEWPEERPESEGPERSDGSLVELVIPTSPPFGFELNDNEREIYLKRTFTITSCGKGTLTYKLTKRIRNMLPQAIENVLTALIRLVPRIDYELLTRLKDSPSTLSQDRLIENIQDGNRVGVRLFDDVSKQLSLLDKNLKEIFEIDHKRKLWEDRHIFFVSQEDYKHKDSTPIVQDMWPKPISQPFAFMVFYLDGKSHREFREKLLSLHEDRDPDYESLGVEKNIVNFEKKFKKRKRFLVSLLYRHCFLNLREKILIPDKDILKFEVSAGFDQHIKCFLHPTSALAFIDSCPKLNKVKKFKLIQQQFLPILVNSIEFDISRIHLAIVLDALLDDLLREVSGIEPRDKNIKKIEELRIKFYRLQLQAALFLEDMSQYAQRGHLGSDMSEALRKTFRIQEIEQRIQRKLEMTERVLLGKQLEIDDAICGLNRPVRQ